MTYLSSHLLIAIPTLVVLTIFYALGWHNQPARNPEKKSSGHEEQRPKTGTKR